jgi:ABC-type branched-subunit amino acid transport system ATPase component
MLKLLNFSGGYSRANMVFKDINLSISENEIVQLAGKNGAGKSSIANGIMGMLPYQYGKILFKNKDISSSTSLQRQKEGISYLLQRNSIFPNLTVSENIKISANDGSIADLENLLKAFAFEDFYKKNKNLKAGYLSGGQKRLLSLLMIMMSNKSIKLLILDEPTAGVEIKNRNRIFSVIDMLINKFKLSVLIIEHNEIFNLTNKIRLIKI